MARSTFQVKMQSTACSDHFWKLRCWKSARRCGEKRISKSKCQKDNMLGPLLKVQMWFCVAGARDSALCQKWAKREGSVVFPKTMAGVGHFKRICADALRVAGAVQETCSSEMLVGQGADFLRRVAFWSIRSSGLLRWFCVTGATLRTLFRGRRSTLDRMEWKHRKTQRYEAVSSCTQLSIFEGSLAELLRFWCCQFEKSRKSRRMAAFLMLPSQKMRMSRRIASFSSLRIDRWMDGRWMDR